MKKFLLLVLSLFILSSCNNNSNNNSMQDNEYKNTIEDINKNGENFKR